MVHKARVVCGNERTGQTTVNKWAPTETDRQTEAETDRQTDRRAAKTDTDKRAAKTDTNYTDGERHKYYSVHMK